MLLVSMLKTGDFFFEVLIATAKYDYHKILFVCHVHIYLYVYIYMNKLMVHIYIFYIVANVLVM